MDASVKEQLEGIHLVLEALKRAPQPNQPIPNSIVLDAAFLSEWAERISNLSKNGLIEEITVFLKEMALPSLDVSDANHEHLKIYHQISELREQARVVLSNAIELGYPHDLSIIARTNEIAPDLRSIETSLDRIEKKIALIEEQTSSGIGDGVAISMGPLSISLGALRRAARLAVQKINLNQESTNVSALIVALSKTASAANEVSRRVNEFILDIPRRFRVALSEVVRLANEAADKGVQLLRSVRSMQSPSVDGAQAQMAVKLAELDVAATLKFHRTQKGLSQAQASRHLKLRLDHVVAIEAGKFGDLPGRTYTIGWVRAYARFLGASPEPILEALRSKLPPEWRQGEPS